MRDEGGLVFTFCYLMYTANMPASVKNDRSFNKLSRIFTYGIACEAIRSRTRQSVDVHVVPSKLMNSAHRAKITIEAIIVGCNRGTRVIQGG